ncbi:MAG: LacI family transcriptional regulator [Microbacteriaceae bacterium]|jgi:DNA-binding LacI/PurR family transcriptional regulator|nr:LacI family transcriptional regulator [Microbacteriaceae bacterium]
MVDVAALAGVSQQTVSRVLNSPDNVSADARERVESAIKRLRYRRNPSARALATKRTHNIGIISFGLAQFGPSVALTGIAEGARRSGYATNLVTLADVDRSHMRAALDHLIADAVDGIIILAPIEAASHSIEGMEVEVPLILFEPGAAQATSNVGADEVRGAALATRHLLDLGHATVHQISGPDGWLGARARLTGWAEELARAGRSVPEPIVGEWSTESGYEAGLAVAVDRSITAVFVANDQMALGVICALRESGLAVPDDVSIIGFDDVPEAPFYTPALTTLRVDFAEIGRQAFDRILDLMNGAPPLLLPRFVPELIVRASTGPPPAARREPTIPNAAAKPF